MCHAPEITRTVGLGVSIFCSWNIVGVGRGNENVDDGSLSCQAGKVKYI